MQKDMKQNASHEHELTISWDGPAIGLLDLDAFFASVEQLDHPEWRGKPVIVGGDADHRGVVSTASYEARRYGVHSAMHSAEAKRLCPQAIWTHGHFDRYRELSARIMSIVEQETPLVEQVSIDEAFFDVTPGRFSRESPVAICQRIQKRVSTLGITCSIGLGTNKTIAKIASEKEKPRGLTVVLPGSERAFLDPLPVRAMSGIGASAEAKLIAMGIHTLGQLAQADPKRLERIFGIMGPRMIIRASGREHSQVIEACAPEDRKSVSNERTFSHDLTARDEVEAAIDHIADMVAHRLREKDLKGRTITLKLKFSYAEGRTAQCQTPQPTRDKRTIAQKARTLLQNLWAEGTPIRLLGIGVSSFDKGEPEQLDLFAAHDHDDEELRERLARTTDQVRARFGKQAISFGYDLRFTDKDAGNGHDQDS